MMEIERMCACAKCAVGRVWNGPEGCLAKREFAKQSNFLPRRAFPKDVGHDNGVYSGVANLQVFEVISGSLYHLPPTDDTCFCRW